MGVIMKNSIFFLFLTGLLGFGCNAKVKVTNSCGDDFSDPQEACDGSDLRSQTCESLGYYNLAGVLACNADCTYDFTDCGGHCGDNVVEPSSGEQCDGENLNGSSCQALNFSGGQLDCNTADCTFDTSACDSVCGNGVLETGEQCDDDETTPGDGCDGDCAVEEGYECTQESPSVCSTVCGDGLVFGEEDCDGDNLGEQTCLTLGFYGGSLVCGDDCTFELTDCATYGSCDDGVLQPDHEACDGSDLAGNSCTSNGFTAGTIACGDDCQLDTSDCTRCGNGQPEAGEQCDGANLRGQTCELLGFTSGSLACGTDCQYDTTACINQNCPNGTIELGEDCEGTNLNGQTCVTQGFASGTLLCNASNCTFNYSNCSLCGNGVVDPGENCDGSDLNNQTCAASGYTAGVLSCNANCTLNTSACTTCGNTLIENGEDCEGSNLASSTCITEGYFKGTLACGSTCLFNYAGCSNCGNGTIQTGEDCDGSSLNGKTCASNGYPGGTLACDSLCDFSTTNCWRWTKVAAGLSHSCGVRSTGTVWCWGANGSGQLGNNTTADSKSPVQVSGISSGATFVEVGRSHSCAIVSGALKCWGSNFYGQLGDNTTTEKHVATNVANMTTGVTNFAAGMYHSCAVKSAGAYCWGRNNYGQLGDNSSTTRLMPVTVYNSSTYVSQVTAGTYHSCLLKTSGSATCWGSNAQGQLGDGTTITRYIPVSVGGGLAAGEVIAAGGSHTCAVVSSNSIYCWGDNDYGQLGTNNTTDYLFPTLVSAGLNTFSGVSAGDNHSCATLVRGGLMCWGKNNYGQLGNNTLVNQDNPVDVSYDIGMTFISGGASHTCAIKTNYIYCWGYNASGQLGDSTAVDRKVPTMIINN